MQRLRTFTLLLFLGLLAGPAFAQPEAPIVPFEPEVESPEEVIGTLILVDESASQVFNLLETITGKLILRRQDIQVKINFNSNGPLTKGEAVLALESLLTLNGVMLTDMGGKFMKAVPATDVNRQVPKMLAESTLGLPASQQIYAKLFPLDYLIAQEANDSIVAPLLSTNSGVVVFPKSNALLVTDALLNLQRIETVLTEADQAQDIRETIQFVKLNFVQATQLQDRIENLIQGPLSAYLEGNTNVSADERSNQLIIITHPSNISVLENVISKIDVDAAPLTSSEVFPLRQARAEEVVPIIENIISGQEEGREEDARVNRENNNNNQTPPANPNGAQTPPTPQTTGGSTSESNSSLQFSNFVGLSADERTNAIVAYGTQSDLRTIKELIEKIDVPLPQVRIEAIITEISLNANESSGITTLGFSINEDGDLVFGGDLDTDDDGNFVQSGGGIFGTGFNIIGNAANPKGTFEAVLSAAESDSDVRILSAPSIVVSHNEEGIINVSESQPIITSSSSTLDNTNTNVRSNVEFRDIGIQLTVTPLIGADGSVQMEIEQTADSVVGETNIDGNTQPIIGRREANSTVTVQDGQVAVLGGLQENTRNDANSYFPLLGRIPGLKEVFGGDSTESSRTEIAIFIRPTVLKKPSEAHAITEKELEVIEAGDAVQEYLENNTTGNIYLEDTPMDKENEEKEGRGVFHIDL